MKKRTCCCGKILLAGLSCVLFFAGSGPGCPVRAEENPERLFFSAGEREILQALRRQGRETRENSPAIEEGPAGELFLRGMYWTSSGRRGVWLEGPAGAAAGRAELRLPAAGDRGTAVLVPDSPPGEVLRAGQILDLVTGRVRELYQGVPDSGQGREQAKGEEDGLPAP